MRHTCISFTSFLIILIASGVSVSFSQNTANQFIDELNVQFESAEVKKLEKAARLLDQADQKFQQAKQMFDGFTDLERKERISDSYSTTLKLLFESSETYKEAYNTAFEVLKDKTDVFWKKMSKDNHRASGMDKARYYEGTALKNLNRSLIRRDQVLESDRFEYSLGIMKNAAELEKLAARDQGRALQICLDYPVEYNYGWEDDKSLEEIIAIMKDPIVHEPPEDIFATVDTTIQVDSSLFREIIFKVQIAAHTIPLSDEYLNTIYKGGLKIDMIYEDDWYKYSIGRYKTFDEAEATRRECNIKKAFVVAYQAGKKISTQEALQILEKKDHSSN
jgi:hypothetical protein